MSTELQQHEFLSAAQLGVWMAQRLDPANTAFNIGQYVELNGVLDTIAFEKALRLVVDETETLRVACDETEDGPRQIIHPHMEWTLQNIDLRLEADPHRSAQRWMTAELARPRNLARGPLFAFALLRLSDTCTLWYQRYHHIIMDGTGVWLVVRRTADIYTSLVSGDALGANPFPALSKLLNDEQSYRASRKFSQDRAYWLEQLADRRNAVTLSQRPAASPGNTLRRTVRLAESDTRRLRALCRQKGTSLTQLVTCALAVYLHRMTGAEDVTLGMAVTGRMGNVARRVPSMMSDVLPLPLAVRSSARLEALLEQIAAQTRRVLRHQRVRSEDLRRSLGLLEGQVALHGPTVNAMPFDYDLRFGECTATTHNLCNGPVADLSIAVYDQSDSQTLRLDFDANAASTIVRSWGNISVGCVRFSEFRPR